jgi:hypothetical protein
MKAFVFLFLVCLGLIGCGGGLESKIVGSWKADTAKTVMGGDKTSEDDKKMAQALVNTMSLDIKADKTFEMKLILPITGKWALSGNMLTLTPDKKEGESMSFGGKPTMDFEVDGSGSTMSMKVDDPKMPGTLVMTKSSS